MAKVDEEALVFSEHSRGAMYSRTWNKSREKLESALLDIYGVSLGRHQALVLPSGMAAIGAALSATAMAKGKDAWTLVYGNELYCEVPRTINYIAESSGCKVKCEAVDVTNGPALLELFRHRSVGIFHFEACTNPSGQFFDFQLLNDLRRLAPDCIFICDNTWLSGALFNPLQHGVDLVVESMTKYISAGRCIGGAVLGANHLMAPILSWIKAFGMFVGADHCNLFLDSLQSLYARMQMTSATARRIAEHLEAHPAVNRVMYPLLSSHPTALVSRRYLKGLGPGCVWFHVSAKKQYIMKLITSQGAAVECKTSFGARSSRLDPWPKAGSSGLYDGDSGRGVQGTWLRLAVGYEEEPFALVETMDRFLSTLDPTATPPVAPAAWPPAEGRWRRKTG